MNSSAIAIDVTNDGGVSKHWSQLAASCWHRVEIMDVLQVTPIKCQRRPVIKNLKMFLCIYRYCFNFSALLNVGTIGEKTSLGVFILSPQIVAALS